MSSDDDSDGIPLPPPPNLGSTGAFRKLENTGKFCTVSVSRSPMGSMSIGQSPTSPQTSFRWDRGQSFRVYPMSRRGTQGTLGEAFGSEGLSRSVGDISPAGSPVHTSASTRIKIAYNGLRGYLAIRASPISGSGTIRKGRLIASGGYASVFSGLDTSNNEIIAIKELLMGATDTAAAFKDIEDEFALIRKLRHENVVRYKFFDYSHSQRKCRIVLEFLSGGSTQAMMKRFGPLKESMLKKLARDVFRGMAFIHEEGIIHRDIKPANILVSAKGVAKLADFGCSKKISEVSSATNHLLGTPVYMSPEFIKGHMHRKADIWAAGCTLFELGTGCPPWHHTRIKDHLPLMFYITTTSETPLVLPKNFDRTFTEEFADFLERCFERSLDKRLDAKELLDHPWLTNISAVDVEGQQALEEMCAEMCTEMCAYLSVDEKRDSYSASGGESAAGAASTAADVHTHNHHTGNISASRTPHDMSFSQSITKRTSVSSAADSPRASRSPFHSTIGHSRFGSNVSEALSGAFEATASESASLQQYLVLNESNNTFEIVTAPKDLLSAANTTAAADGYGAMSSQDLAAMPVMSLESTMAASSFALGTTVGAAGGDANSGPLDGALYDSATASTPRPHHPSVSTSSVGASPASSMGGLFGQNTLNPNNSPSRHSSFHANPLSTVANTTLAPNASSSIVGVGNALTATMLGSSHYSYDSTSARSFSCQSPVTPPVCVTPTNFADGPRQVNVSFSQGRGRKVKLGLTIEASDVSVKYIDKKPSFVLAMNDNIRSQIASAFAEHVDSKEAAARSHHGHHFHHGGVGSRARRSLRRKETNGSTVGHCAGEEGEGEGGDEGEDDAFGGWVRQEHMTHLAGGRGGGGDEGNEADDEECDARDASTLSPPYRRSISMTTMNDSSHASAGLSSQQLDPAALAATAPEEGGLVRDLQQDNTDNATERTAASPTVVASTPRPTPSLPLAASLSAGDVTKTKTVISTGGPKSPNTTRPIPHQPPRGGVGGVMLTPTAAVAVGLPPQPPPSSLSRSVSAIGSVSPSRSPYVSALLRTKSRVRIFNEKDEEIVENNDDDDNDDDEEGEGPRKVRLIVSEGERDVDSDATDTPTVSTHSFIKIHRGDRRSSGKRRSSAFGGGGDTTNSVEFDEEHFRSFSSAVVHHGNNNNTNINYNNSLSITINNNNNNNFTYTTNSSSNNNTGNFTSYYAVPPSFTTSPSGASPSQSNATNSIRVFGPAATTATGGLGGGSGAFSFSLQNSPSRQNNNTNNNNAGTGGSSNRLLSSGAMLGGGVVGSTFSRSISPSFVGEIHSNAVSPTNAAAAGAGAGGGGDSPQRRIRRPVPIPSFGARSGVGAQRSDVGSNETATTGAVASEEQQGRGDNKSTNERAATFKPQLDGTTNDADKTKTQQTSAEGKDRGSEINATAKKSGSLCDAEAAPGLRPQFTMKVETSHSPANSSDTDKAHGTSPSTPTAGGVA